MQLFPVLIAGGPGLGAVGAVNPWVTPLQRPQRLIAASAGRTNEVSGLGRHILIIRERLYQVMAGVEESEKSPMLVACVTVASPRVIR